MKSKQTSFFAIYEDVKILFNEIEFDIEVNYFDAGLFNSKSVGSYHSILDIKNLGFVVQGDWNRIDRYLAMNLATTLKIRDVPQRNGEIMYAVDQLSNPKSIEIKVGGVLQSHENVIVAGRVSTVGGDNDSDILYSLFSKKIKKQFSRIGNFYVGKNAEQKLKDGWRLVTNVNLQREYDLTYRR